MKLTDLQWRFIEAFMGPAGGNATEAARIAGYSGSKQTLWNMGAANLRKPEIIEEIEKRRNASPQVATREERQIFWSSIMRGVDPYDKDEGKIPMKDRLKASEMLGKTQLDFAEVIVHKGALAHDVKLDLAALSDEALSELNSVLKVDEE